MSGFARILKGLADVCGQSEYQLAQLSGLVPAFVRRLFAGEKRASNLTIIRLTIALVMDPKLAQTHPARVPFILSALKDAHLGVALESNCCKPGFDVPEPRSLRMSDQ